MVGLVVWVAQRAIDLAVGTTLGVLVFQMDTGPVLFDSLRVMFATVLFWMVASGFAITTLLVAVTANFERKLEHAFVTAGLFVLSMLALPFGVSLVNGTLWDMHEPWRFLILTSLGALAVFGSSLVCQTAFRRWLG